MMRYSFLLFFFLLGTPIFPADEQKPGGTLSKKVALPPVIEFKGSSLSLMAPDSDPWQTPAEAKGLEDTPDYVETMAFLRKMVEASPSLKMVSLGKSREGREIWMVIASNQQLFTPQAVISSKFPVCLVQAGIHSGEIDGKDAGLMLLRDMTVSGTKKELLDRLVFLFIPILSVDGHERRSEYNRINQRGPVSMGWRTNAENLNLNRDYAKADTEGIQAVLKCLNLYRPHLYFDIHVTDGIDYQYDITFGGNGTRGFSPSSGQFLAHELFPDLDRALKTAGHIPGPLVFARDNQDLKKGIVNWFASPRFSNGYGDLAHIPTVLVENHSLKPYRQRVLGTYILLEQTLKTLVAKSSQLFAAIEKDRAIRTRKSPNKWGNREKNGQIEFHGIDSERYLSDVSGVQEVRWLGTPKTMTIPVIHRDKPTEWVQKPTAFYVPGSWSDIIRRLRLHGIKMEEIKNQMIQTTTHLRFNEPEFSKMVYEGHFRVTAEFVAYRKETVFAPGSVRIPLDQPLGDLIMALLDPRFSDSFFQWGFFNQIFQRTEYTEAYAIEPYALEMLKDPFIQEAFNKKLEEDEAFRTDRWARLYWFYEKTPYYDQQWKVYPISWED